MFKELQIQAFSDQEFSSTMDAIAIEEPLQIFIKHLQGEKISLSITMRTPGQDHELVLGQLFTERVIQSRDDVIQIVSKGPINQQVEVTLSNDVSLDQFTHHRHIIQHGGCGVCGKTSLDFLDKESAYIHRPGLPRISPKVLFSIQESIQKQQGTFQKTGGVHAAALFDENGEFLAIREDIGRHNAMDKIVGWALENNYIPLKNFGILFSGRTSYELIQKANDAGISIVASIGAPSSLAIELAEENGMTLIGFLKSSKYNLYSDLGRVEHSQE